MHLRWCETKGKKTLCLLLSQEKGRAYVRELRERARRQRSEIGDQRSEMKDQTSGAQRNPTSDLRPLTSVQGSKKQEHEQGS